MLTSTRSLVRNPFFIIPVLVLLVGGFAIFGVSDVFIQSGNSVATVRNERVSAMDYAEAWEFRLRDIQQEQPTMTAEQARELGLADAVLNQLVVQAQLRAMASSLGLDVSDDEVAREISGYGAFIDPVTGRFDSDSYRGFLADQRMTVSRFESSVERDLMTRQLIDALFAGIDVPDAFARQIYQYSFEERAIRGLVIPPSAAGDLEDPTDEQLQAVIDETLNDAVPQNDFFFQNPERRGFTLVRFRVSDFTRNIVVSEDDIRAQYDYEVEGGELGDPALRSYVQIRVPDQASAEAAAEQLAAGEDPAAVAEAVGGDAPFSETERQSYQIPDEAIADALFEMETGEARAIEGGFGWFAVAVTDGRDATIPTFEEREEDIRELLAQAEAENAMYEAMGLFEEARGDGATLEEAAVLAETFYEVFEPVDQNARNADGYPAGTLLSADDQASQYFSFFLESEPQPEILETVFEQLVGYATELQPYGESDYFAVRIDTIEAAAVQPLDEVREDAEALWRIQSVDERLTELSESALARAEAGESLDAIAADIPGATVETTTVTRSDTTAPFGRDAIGLAFQLEAGDFARAGGADRRSHIVVTVDEVTQPETIVEADLASYQEQTIERYSRDVDAAFVSALQERYPATINPTLRDQVLGVTDPNASR